VNPASDQRPSVAGIPPGLVGVVLSILGSSTAPIRRRKLLEELERRGHRISLAGLNRTLQHCAEAGLTSDTPEGVRLTTRAR
jgi:Fe2+ or Zn2+ uptake regulation protein